MIDVILPVGPYPNDKKWLDEALVSIQRQTMPNIGVIIIDDGANIDHEKEVKPYLGNVPYAVWPSPWRVGCADAWNIGVGLSLGQLCFFMGSDDWLESECLEACYEAYERSGHRDGYYHVNIRYDDTGEEQDLPCNAAMVTKPFWLKIGGFPPEAGLGAPDALIISGLLANSYKSLKKVSDLALYNVRRHEHQETARMNRYHKQIGEVRDVFTREVASKW